MRPHLMPSSRQVGGGSWRTVSGAALTLAILLAGASAATGQIVVNQNFYSNPGCFGGTFNAAPPGVNTTFMCLGNTISVRGLFDEALGLELGARVDGSVPMLYATGFFDYWTPAGAPGTRLYWRLTLNITGSGTGLLSIQNPYAGWGCGGFPGFVTTLLAGSITVDVPFCTGVQGLLQLDLLVGTGANYYDTLRLTSVEVLDDNKQPIPGARVISDSGLVYPGVTAPFSFTGFFQPIDNLPAVNLSRAGSAIPVKFSLGGDHGLDILAPGYPRSTGVVCSPTSPTALLEETASAGPGGLHYDPVADQYIYVWKTERAWTGTCRELVVRLSDGTVHLARFRFTN